METQPVERVTAERRKNPKKVAAGKAAYAARKEREAKMLETLQNHKNSLKESEPEPRSSESERSKPREPERSKPREPEQTPSKQVPVASVAAVLGFGIGAAICWFILQKDRKPETKSSILKTSAQSNIYDPFDL